MKSKMNWDRILQVPEWTPLSKVTDQGELVLPGVYRVAPDAYLVSQLYNREFEERQPGAPFVTLAVWAESGSGLKRCITSDPFVHVATPTVKPPEILLLGTQGTYGELEGQIPTIDRKIAERAVYSNTGAFVHKVIVIGRFSFCFLTPNIARDDRVYAIEVRLTNKEKK